MAKVTGLRFALIYADDFEKTKNFYRKYFGFEEASELTDTSLGPQTWGHIGETSMWIGAGHTKKDVDEATCRTGVMFGIDSVGSLFKELKADGVRVIQEEPMNMQEGMYWLQFEDPSGNIIEVLGGQ